MDLFKKKNIKQATDWDWNVPQISKRNKEDTAKLHRLSRRRLKQELRKDIENENKM